MIRRSSTAPFLACRSLSPTISAESPKACAPSASSAAFSSARARRRPIGVLSGFLLVHILSVEAYAQFGIATAFQGVFTILMDVGFAATIVPLVGDRGPTIEQVIGRYVRAARHLRDRSFWILAPVASIAFFATVRAHHWSWKLQSPAARLRARQPLLLGRLFVLLGALVPAGPPARVLRSAGHLRNSAIAALRRARACWRPERLDGGRPGRAQHHPATASWSADRASSIWTGPRTTIPRPTASSCAMFCQPRLPSSSRPFSPSSRSSSSASSAARCTSRRSQPSAASGSSSSCS